MAERAAWTVKDGNVIIDFFEFNWNGGFALVQKQKNIIALHNSIKKKYNETALEVSSKSMDEIGRKIGAFSLKKDEIYLENMFQAAKKYENGGPYNDLINVSPKEAKTDERHHNSGKLQSFVYNNNEWPLEPKTAFYDFLYINTIVSKYGSDLDLSRFKWFTDIEFNPKKSVNCQARSIAIYTLLQKKKSFDVINNMQQWIDFHRSCVKS